MRKGKNPYKAMTSSEVEKMNIEQARKELKQARDDSLWLWLTAKRDIMAEVMVDENNPEWAREEAKQSYGIICYKLEKLARKMDNAADTAFIGEASDTPDTRKKYYRWDPTRMINVEVENND